MAGSREDRLRQDVNWLGKGPWTAQLQSSSRKPNNNRRHHLPKCTTHHHAYSLLLLPSLAFPVGVELFQTEIKQEVGDTETPAADTAATAAGAAAEGGQPSRPVRSSKYTGVSWNDRIQRWEVGASYRAHLLTWVGMIALNGQFENPARTATHTCNPV